MSIEINENTYNQIKYKINAMMPYFETAIDELNKCSDQMKNGVIVNGEAFDKGSLAKKATRLGEIKADMQGIYNLCNIKISELPTDTDTE